MICNWTNAVGLLHCTASRKYQCKKKKVLGKCKQRSLYNHFQLNFNENTNSRNIENCHFVNIPVLPPSPGCLDRFKHDLKKSFSNFPTRRNALQDTTVDVDEIVAIFLVNKPLYEACWKIISHHSLEPTKVVTLDRCYQKTILSEAPVNRVQLFKVLLIVIVVLHSINRVYFHLWLKK